MSGFDISRGFLPKPSYGAACNSCGRCCAAQQCIVSVALFGERDLCPALEDGGDQRLVCGVIRNPDFYASTPKWSSAVLGEALALVIGAGIGCDSEEPGEPAAAVMAGRRAIYGRSASALDRASPEARRLVDLLRDSDSGSQSEDAPAAEGEAPQNGGEANRPTLSASASLRGVG